MDLFTRRDLRTLLADHPGPCVSLFMPVHRSGAKENSIRFHNLLNKAEEGLTRHGLNRTDAEGFLMPLRTLTDDPTFWSYQSDGLAAFLAGDYWQIYRLPYAFREDVEVGGLFRVTPLLPLMAGDGRFYLLSLSQNGVRLFQGTRYTMSPIDLKRVPRSLAEALRTHDRGEVLTSHNRTTSGGTWGAIFEGHVIGKDAKQADLLHDFREIDRGLHELLREDRAPLVLAAVEYLMPIYREANTYPHLLDAGVAGNLDRLSVKDLHDRAWAVVEPHFRERQEHATDVFQHASGTGKATADPGLAIPAAYRGEVETLFVALGEHMWGTLDPSAGQAEFHQQQEVGDEDLLDVAALHTLRHGNTVYAVAPDQVPGGKGLAAVYHLPLAKHGKRR